MSTIKIDSNGKMSFIYSDDMADLLGEGRAIISRASHIEPSEGGGWQADMAPVGGPALFGFKFRQEALDAEVKFLNDTLFGGLITR